MNNTKSHNTFYEKVTRLPYNKKKEDEILKNQAWEVFNSKKPVSKRKRQLEWLQPQ